MEFRERIESAEGLADLSIWHNGNHWTAAARIADGRVELGYGATVGGAVLTALAELELRRDEAPRAPRRDIRLPLLPRE